MKQLLERIILSLSVFLISMIPILSSGKSSSGVLELLHGMVAFICSFALFSYGDKPFSCYKVIHLFYLFFFGIAPIMQFKNNIRLFGTYFLEDDYIQTSLYLLGVLCLFNFIYYYEFKRQELIGSVRESSIRIEYASFNGQKKFLMLLVSFAVCLIYLYINKFNILAIVSRGGFKSVEMNQSLTLVIDHVLRPLPLFMFLVSVQLKDRLFSFVLFLLFFISNPFTGMARNAVAAMYLPIVLWCFSFFRKRNVFVFAISMGLLVIFPFLNKFRHLKDMSKLNLDLDFSQFLDMNFDSYSMFMRVLKADIITWGNQLLGVVFFWIPRSLWETKPIGSGAFTAQESHLIFTNLSMPYFGEGYLNFGMLGVFVFTFILAIVSSRLDASYWLSNKDNSKNFESLKYYVILGLIMFIMRGDLLSSFAYTVGYILSFYVAKKIIVSSKYSDYYVN